MDQSQYLVQALQDLQRGAGGAAQPSNQAGYEAMGAALAKQFGAARTAKLQSMGGRLGDEIDPATGAPVAAPTPDAAAAGGANPYAGLKNAFGLFGHTAGLKGLLGLSGILGGR